MVAGVWLRLVFMAMGPEDKFVSRLVHQSGTVFRIHLTGLII